MSSIFESANNNWPEDEAHEVMDHYRITATEDEPYARRLLSKDIDHFAKVFSYEQDGDALFQRFLAVLKNDGII